MQTIYAYLRCRDSRALIDWLVRCFGFREVLAVPGPRGDGIVHAQVAFGSDLVMISDDRLGRLGGMEAAGDQTAKSYGVYVGGVADIDALYERARAAGARMMQEIYDASHGSRDFTAVGPEDTLWSFGTYRPQADGPPPA